MLAIEIHSVHDRFLLIGRNKKQRSTATNTVGTTKSIVTKLVKVTSHALTLQIPNKTNLAVLLVSLSTIFSKQDFCIDTGLDVSVLSAHNCKSNRKTTKTIKLFAANGSPFHTYGGKRLQLNLDLRRSKNLDFCTSQHQLCHLLTC